MRETSQTGGFLLGNTFQGWFRGICLPPQFSMTHLVHLARTCPGWWSHYEDLEWSQGSQNGAWSESVEGPTRPNMSQMKSCNSIIQFRKKQTHYTSGIVDMSWTVSWFMSQGFTMYTSFDHLHRSLNAVLLRHADGSAFALSSRVTRLAFAGCHGDAKKVPCAVHVVSSLREYVKIKNSLVNDVWLIIN